MKQAKTYIPYTYLIGWSAPNLWYYGVEIKQNKRNVANPDNLWKTYFTSSKFVKEIRNKFGEPDIILIRKTFTCPIKAYQWEQKVLTRMKVVGDKKWLNRAIYNKKEFTLNPEKTVSSRKNNGKPWHSEITKTNISKFKIDKIMNLSDDERKRRSSHFTERNLSDSIFKEQNKLGRKRRWENKTQVEAQSNRMRISVHSEEAYAKRKTTLNSPEHKARRNHDWFNNGERERYLETIAKRRGYSKILIDDNIFYTVKECAKFMQLSEACIRKRIKAGKIITQ